MCSALIVGYIFKKYIISPEAKNFRDNADKITKLLFHHINMIDVDKSEVYSIIDNKIDSWNDDIILIHLNDFERDRIFSLLSKMRKEIDNISFHEAYSLYSTITQRILMLKYVYSAISVIKYIPHTNKFIINKKELSHHAYYAKEIIELFDDKTDVNYKTKWEKQFSDMGGVEKIVQPKITMGIINERHHNLYNQLFHDTSHHITVMNKINDLYEKLNDMEKNKNVDSSTSEILT